MATKKVRAKVKRVSITRSFADHVVEAAAAAAPTPILRKSAAALTAPEQQTFKNAVTRAITDGIYSTLVRIHANMSHDMHSMSGMPAGTQRFLPWHRLYLVNFEQAMRRFEPTFFVPYWRWMDQQSIPAWLNSFKPKGITDANGHAIPVRRNPGTSPNPAARSLPTSQTIQTTVMNKATYTPFTLALEGAQPFGAHNLVHVWFNGTMSNVPTAPADPMFWMHHAEIDRIWWIWQKTHAGQDPTLTGADAVLDPWPEHVTDVLDIATGNHPYSYDRTQL